MQSILFSFNEVLDFAQFHTVSGTILTKKISVQILGHPAPNPVYRATGCSVVAIDVTEFYPTSSRNKLFYINETIENSRPFYRFLLLLLVGGAGGGGGGVGGQRGGGGGNGARVV